MKKKAYKISTFISAIIWTILTLVVGYVKFDLGTVATLGGIALMFAWMYEKENLTN